MHIASIALIFILALVGDINATQELTQSTATNNIRIIFPDGAKYVGQFLNGMKHGRGRFISADGSEYRGEFMHGEPHGTGTYIHADGRKKRVVFDMGRLIDSKLLPHEVTGGGCVFGEFENFGMYKGWYRGNRIKGFIPHGRGVMRYVNGSVYTGQWKNGTMHGNGTIEWSEGSLYVGQWAHGKRSGYGTYTWANGDRYVGQWKENEMCGNGTFFHRDGSVEKGNWKERIITVN